LTEYAGTESACTPQGFLGYAWPVTPRRNCCGCRYGCWAALSWLGHGATWLLLTTAAALCLGWQPWLAAVMGAVSAASVLVGGPSGLRFTYVTSVLVKKDIVRRNGRG
jgi:hypothetical protein